MRSEIWIALIVAMACKPRELEFRRFELPGFSLDAPDFFDGKRTDFLYDDDSLVAQDGLQVMSVTWDQGEILSVQELPTSVKAVMAELVKDQKLELEPARAVTIGGQSATRVDGKMGILDMTFADITCGGRSVMIQLMAPRVEVLRERVLGSFTCTPDPAKEKAMGARVAIGVDDPATLAGFSYADKPGTTPMSISDGEAVAVFDTTTGDSEDLELLRKLLPKMFGVHTNIVMSPGKRETRGAGARERVFDHGVVTLEGGEKRWAVTTLWRCEGSTKEAVLALVLVADPARAATSVDWLMKIRCARPGDPPLPLGPAPNPE
ncbi:MAG: hypothetical protein ABI867_00135 [Kofleriaceae bacterium]